MPVIYFIAYLCQISFCRTLCPTHMHTHTRARAHTDAQTHAHTHIHIRIHVHIPYTSPLLMPGITHKHAYTQFSVPQITNESYTLYGYSYSHIHIFMATKTKTQMKYKVKSRYTKLSMFNNIGSKLPYFFQVDDTKQPRPRLSYARHGVAISKKWYFRRLKSYSVYLIRLSNNSLIGQSIVLLPVLLQAIA